ncbi:STAS domain-containing protein, partial [Streptosporangium sp. KLBMP 9127]|nr:STAS domain-containing protein [Streptosporangium sp. KLBMP 9127]
MSGLGADSFSILVECDLDEDDGCAWIFPAGRLDVDAAAEFAAVFGECFAARYRHLIVDASLLEFCDGAGARVLVDASRQAEECSVEFRLTGAYGSVARVIAIAGLTMAEESSHRQPVEHPSPLSGE